MIFDKQELNSFVRHQVYNFYNYWLDTELYQDEAILRTDRCFSQSANKYFEKHTKFSTFHTTQYCIYLYFLSKIIFEVEKNGENAEKVYCLNKALHGVELYYAIELPKIWGTEHPLGSIMGRAQYSDKFFFYQGCTVGGNNFFYPTIGENVTMYSGSKILGKSVLGNNVILSANTYIKDETIPNNCLVFGQSPNLIIKAKSEEAIVSLTKHIWK